MSTLQEYLPLLRETCYQAGDEILKIYHSEDFNIQKKTDQSPVTRADLAANRIITKKLQATGIPILSEEEKEVPYQERSQWESFWLVDPLDGTKEFIKKNGEFTVNIALMQNNEPVLGAVYIPVKKQLYYGGKGIGTFTQFKGQAAKELHRSPTSRQKVRIVTSRSHLNQETKEYIQSFKNAETTPSGSSLKFMLIAESKADIYPRFGPTMEWDTAASHAILRGINLEILKMTDNKPLQYNKKELLNPFFIVKAQNM